MLTLYADNFRGFTDTFIPLSKVNFLVGENSTGKTSILSMINLMRNWEFWINADFNAGEINLGYFDEIASAYSLKDKPFRIGFSRFLREKGKDSGRLHCHWMEFINVRNIPQLSRFRIFSENLTVSIKAVGEEIYYKTYEMPPIEWKQFDEVSFFKNWIHESDENDEGWKLVSKEHQFGSKFSAYNWVYSVERSVSDNKSSDTRLPLADFRSFINRSLTWIAPIRAKPRRTYDSYKMAFSPEGDHAPYLLKRYLAEEVNGSKAFKESLKSFGLNSELFSDLITKNYGRETTSPFEIHVYLNKRRFKISNVGYGVSQVLPILVELLTPSRGKWFAIQQPEVHLHPKAQAALGNFIYDICTNANATFIIETHSDFLIDRFRLAYNKGQQKWSAPPRVIFFERMKNGNRASIIPIEANGTYSDSQPEAFREFFIRESFEMLAL